MADVEPDTTIGYNSSRFTVVVDSPGGRPFVGGREIPIHGLKLLSFYFADVDNAEVFKPPRGTVACAFQANTIDDRVAANIDPTGIVFKCAGNDKGWLHVLCRASLSQGTTTTEAPAAKLAAGYVDPYTSIYLNHRDAAPNTLTSGQLAVKLGLKLRIFPFIILNASDRWTSETGAKCPGIVAVAWQAGDENAGDQVSVTLDAAGDVIFTPDTPGAPDVGWLWAWTR